MPLRFEIDPESRLVRTIAEGDVGADDIRDYLVRLERDPEYAPDFDALIDVRSVTSGITPEELRDIAELVRRRPKGAESKRAVVVSSDEHFGLMRMFEAYTATGPTRYRVFRDPAEATAWIESDPESE